METSPLPVKGCITLPRHLRSLSSEGSLAYHTYCDTGHPFIMVISEYPWHSYLLPYVWQCTCHYLYFRHRYVANGIRTSNLPLAERTLYLTSPPPRPRYSLNTNQSEWLLVPIPWNIYLMFLKRDWTCWRVIGSLITGNARSCNVMQRVVIDKRPTCHCLNWEMLYFYLLVFFTLYFYQFWHLLKIPG